MPKLSSMDVTIRGVTKTYVFDPATPVDSDDEGEASLQLVGEAETTEVEMATSTIASARVTVSYTVRYDGEVEVDLDDLDGIDDGDDLVYQAEMGNFSDIQDAIDADINDVLSGGDYVSIDSIQVDEAFDEDGCPVEL